MPSRDADIAVAISLGASVVMGAAQFAGFVFTGASALLASTTHALGGALAAALVIFGSRRPDQTRYSERAFWSIVAPILPLSIGAGTTITEGLGRLSDVRPIDQPQFAYAAVGVAAVFALLALWSVATALDTRAFSIRRLAEVRAADEPVLFGLVLQSLALIAGIGAALMGLIAADWMQVRDADGMASLTIGLIMAATAALLAIETKALVARRTMRPTARTALLPDVDAGDRAGQDGSAQIAAVTNDGESDQTHNEPASRKSRKKSRRAAR